MLKWPNLDRKIVTLLSRVLAPNPYVRTFRSLGNLGPLEKYRVELTTSVKDDQRLYNRPTTSEVAGIWVEGNDNITTYKRIIVVYGRSEYPTQIQAYFACYDPLSCPMFFPNGKAEWHKRILRGCVDIRSLWMMMTMTVPKTKKVHSNRLGQVNVLHVSFIGGLRDMRKRFLDAMTLVQDAGKPDIFLMTTCNPNWPEIVENLYEGKTASDRPDLVTRVFRAKLEYLKHLIFTKHILGVVSSHIYVIEFQNQGLPHAHFLLIMTSTHNLANPDHYDKNYPRQFQETTQQGDDSYPLYRWRDNGIEVWSSIKTVKYIFKYIYKGHDKQVVNVEKDGGQVVNEIKRFQDARHEAFVRFREDDVLTNIIERERNKRYMLIAFFELNETDTNARKYLYRHIPRYYTWNKSILVWKQRKQGKIRDRMVFANPPEGERFYLRVLLQHVKGPTGFDYLYTVDDVLYTTFRRAALERGLIKSDSYIHECLRESSTRELPYALRRLFATILIFCEPGDVRKLWDDHYESLSEDYTLNFVQEEDILARNSLNTDQKNAYDTIMQHVDADSLGVFFINGPGGTGKTFLYKALLANVHSRGLIALATTSSGAAANNMTGGRTAHSRFKLIIWDEASMAKRQAVEAVDRTMQDVTGIKLPFGGNIMVLGGGRYENYVRIPDDMTIPYANDDASKNVLINEIFPSFATNARSSSDIVLRTILSTKNEHVDIINNELIDRFPGEEKVYYSFDEAEDDTHDYYPLEFLNLLKVSGLPPHCLRLKIGCPIILIRNLDPANGLCNGTRLICKHFDPNVINAEIVAGQHAGVRVLLPRIPLAPSKEDMFPFKLKRTQFPIRLSFAMTINKAQGQTIPNVGVYLPESVFSHGRLYVALSRGISRTTTKVLVKPEKEVDQPGVYTANVVYLEVLRNE
uniref:ATP-dependent DNA helicase n=1 Tax=Tanacetum cinerariifolium TaxID=118510 RepID=A0A699GYE1_TANCI|nr:ATP-dependent DNA helicase PIF1 [Tanacetum cinerariifolium]